MLGRLILLVHVMAAALYADLQPYQGLYSLFPINWAGIGSMRKGDYSTALKQALIDSAVGDSLYHEFKLGVIYMRMGQFENALVLFRGVAEKNGALAPLVYEYIGEIEQKLGNSNNSLAAFRTVLQGDIPQRYRHYIFERIRTAFEADSTLQFSGAAWLEEYYRWLAPIKVPAELSLADSITLLLDQGMWGAVDSILTKQPLSGKEGCRVIGSIRAALNGAALSVGNLFNCAMAASRCGDLHTADQLLRQIQKRPRYLDSLSEKRFLYFSAQLDYERSEWHSTIKKFKHYSTKYGQDPEALMYIARAYRKLDRDNAAAEWYDKLITLFPHHSKVQEILWLRAWQNEDNHHFDRAVYYYQQLIKRFPKGSRVDESYLREALCFYRTGKYETARALLEQFTEKSPLSPLQLTAYYWQAKCYHALGQNDNAMMVWRLVSHKEPFDYYAHRARQELMLLGDTLTIYIDTTMGINYTLSWLDTISLTSQKKVLSSKDSLGFIQGLFLASVGDYKKADYFLEPIELSYPGNLALQFKLATLYMLSDASAYAFRVARRFTWRIPPLNRSELPFDMYRLLYPPFYATYIKQEAARNSIQPFLVSAVIRQESIFNPQIKSPAGAIGLMQIMPYTGEYIAKKLDAQFSLDSLEVPAFNIKFGTYYLKELFNQFDENAILALASYNAGPHNAKKWEKRNGDEEMDLFVEDIGFTETRNYVKKVLGNLYTYEFLAKYPSYNYGGDLDRFVHSFSKPIDHVTPEPVR